MVEHSWISLRLDALLFCPCQRRNTKLLQALFDFLSDSDTHTKHFSQISNQIFLAYSPQVLEC